MKINLSALMRVAWGFVKENGFTMSEAIKQAWMQFKLRARLANGVVKFVYKKVSGEIRYACGTLLNPPTTKGTRGGYPGCQAYYDMDAQAWRSYRIENLMEIVC